MEEVQKGLPEGVTLKSLMTAVSLIEAVHCQYQKQID